MIWTNEFFSNNIINKLSPYKTYFLETNNAGTNGILVGIIRERKSKGPLFYDVIMKFDILTPL